MRNRAQRRFMIAFLAPAFLLYTGFVAIPIVRAFLYSLQGWTGFGEPKWVGLKNFCSLFLDKDLFLAALSHNVILMLGGGGGALALALLFAALIHRRVRGAAIFRVAFFFPNVMASVAVALLWLLLYSTTEFGVVNGFLHGLQEASGLTFVRLPFPFTDSKYLIYAMIPMTIWTATGFYMILFLAAMQNIPESYYEAAKLDGAGPVTQFFRITLPLIREVLVVGIVFFVISALKIFDAVWVMENQFPQKQSHVLATLLYQKVFSEYDIGYGAAVAVVLFVLVFLATLVTLRLSRREAVEY